VFRNLFSKKRALTGAPPAPRMKTYSAQSGYVYEYYYEGRRPAGASGADVEFVFNICGGGARRRPASVFLNGAAVASWQRRRSREFSSTELYALAKMALFQAFDEWPAPDRMKDAVTVREADIDVFAGALGLE